MLATTKRWEPKQRADTHFCDIIVTDGVLPFYAEKGLDTPWFTKES
jgi:hypothetical protein